MKTLTVLFAVFTSAFASAQFHAVDPGSYHDLYIMNADGSGVTNLTLGTREERTPDWSPDGTKIAYAADDIYVINADGTGRKKLTDIPGLGLATSSPSWSPDGRQIAFAGQRDGIFDIYVMAADGGNEINLTRTPAKDGGPAWSPDGTTIAFASDRTGKSEIYVMDDDGGNQRQITFGGPQGRHSAQPAWSPAGKLIAYTVRQGTQRDIFVMDEDGAGQVQLTAGAEPSEHPAWSPDGSKIAFTSVGLIDGFRSHSIFVMNADGSNPARVRDDATGRGRQPAWSPDGTRLVFKTFRKPSVDNLQHGQLVIFENGGMETTAGSGDFPAIVYSTKDADGKETRRAITVEEAVEILRQQGDPRFATPPQP